jgi:hydroxymethylbilane synthase
LDVAVEPVVLSTSGDRDLSRPIAELASSAPFSDDLERALREGQIDAAVHCLKDLPVSPTPGLMLAAILERGDPREVLVSRDRLGLHELPAGAVVGTSSPRRAAQLHALRADLVARPMRGPVEDRVRQVRAGRFDAALLAAAGLQRLGLAEEIVEYFDPRQFMPAPAQAALAIQVRAGDRIARRLVGRLDHRATRRAVTAELEFLRFFDHRTDVTAAAIATGDRTVELCARLLRCNGEMLWQGRIAGPDPRRIARHAAGLAAARAGLEEVA